ncbi:TPA: Fe-S cluster assembly protein SufD [archaeon]|uniref:Fe-S cluster assembly protein SufD n=1 Tax=Candidatus Naiadarchaeum limnaeum TaxID=2756139 RepID=A0A832XLT2_9ARCH|nr:Fe-S cluster assembly protein SufD [Candidatus Naiadarchaeum limnaeum]
MTQNLAFTEQTLAKVAEKESDFLASLRKNNFSTFEKLPLPNQKEEEWRYTDLTPLKLSEFSLPEKKHGFNFSWQSNKEVIFMPLALAAREHEDLVEKHLFKTHSPFILSDKFAALQSAFWQEGVFVYVPKNVVVEDPVSLTAFVVDDGKLIAYHNLIVLEENSSAKFYEDMGSEKGKNLFIEGSEVVLSKDSKLDYYSFQNYNPESFSFSFKRGNLAKDSTLNWNFALFGGRIGKAKVDTVFNGENSRSELQGIYFGQKEQHLAIITNSYHNVPRTTNRIVTKGVLKDKASSFSRGLARIEKSAPKTDSYLADHVIHLSGEAQSNSIPSLEIINNDVKAAHAASSGEVNEDQLFYLMSRGLNRNEAEMLIVEGFFEPILQKIKIGQMQAKSRWVVEKRVRG